MSLHEQEQFLGNITSREQQKESRESCDTQGVRSTSRRTLLGCIVLHLDHDRVFVFTACV